MKILKEDLCSEVSIKSYPDAFFFLGREELTW